jgi:hypothetical protein
MNIKELAEILQWMGHLKQSPGGLLENVSNEEVKDALEKFQDFNGLDKTGTLTPETERLIGLPRCGQPDVMMNMTGQCAWPMTNVTWHQAVQLSQLPPDRVQAVFLKAHQQWADVCGIEPINVDDPSKANITSRQGSGRRDQLDGPMGILAYSELPCGVASNTQLQQVYDADENWSESMLLAVACHEIGHAYGLQHSSKGNLMAPYYDPNITGPQAGDIAEMVARYGPPKPKPVPTPTPTPTGTPVPGDTGEEVVIPGGQVVINGKVFILTTILTPRNG